MMVEDEESGRLQNWGMKEIRDVEKRSGSAQQGSLVHSKGCDKMT